MPDQFFTVQKIGPKQKKTTEGFLLCEEVPLARTGVMLYAAVEIPSIEPTPDGVIKLHRNDEDVFHADTISSANGKPVTNDHPEDDVDPTNWNDLAIGICMNVRKGDGYMDDLLIGDLLITNKDGINLIESGKREISLGYTADLEEIGVGEGKQTNIRVNHIALVENGRCGHRCAISDKASEILNERKDMKFTNKKRSKVRDRLLKIRDAMKLRDSDQIETLMDELEEELDINDEVDPVIASEGENDDIHIHLDSNDMGGTGEGGPTISFTDDDINAFIEQNQAEHAEMIARIEALEAAVSSGQQTQVGDEEVVDPEDVNEEVVADEFPEEVEDPSKLQDSRYLDSVFRDTIAMAEILSPGIKLPIFDSAAKPTTTVKKICALRRKALTSSYKDSAAMAKVIESLNGGKSLKIADMSCQAVKTLFNGAATIASQSNNTGVVGRITDQQTVSQTTSRVKSPAEMNKFFADFYAEKK